MNITLYEQERIDDLAGGLKIIQNSSAPCFAIDAVLLADFVPAEGKTKKETRQIVDLGTGTGIIPLLLSRKFSTVKIVAIELMSKMAEMSKRSVALNKLEQQIEIITGDIRNIEDILPKAAADIVTANPPYYKLGQGRDNKDPLSAAARQEKHCTQNDILAAARLLLRPLGRLYIVQRAERFGELMAALSSYQLNAERIRFVQPSAEKEANLVLLQAQKAGRGKLHLLPPLVVYSSKDTYTKEMQDIYAR